MDEPNDLGGPALIVTVAFNPAIDVSTSVASMAPIHKLRCGPARREPGGGGVNVARVARRLGVATTAVTTSGGATGAEVVSSLEAEGVDCRPVPIEGFTRESFSIHESETNDDYRFVLPGPVLSQDETNSCVETIVDAARHAATVVVSGSLPQGVDPEVIGVLARRLPGARLIVDTSGPALEAAVRSPVELVKPSVRELESLVHRPLETEADVVEAALDVQSRALCRSMVASMGPGGAIVLADGLPPMRVRAPTVRVRSAIGAGDSLVAGIAVALAEGADLVEATRRGIAAGTATVMSEGTGLCHPDDVERLLRLVSVEPWS